VHASPRRAGAGLRLATGGVGAPPATMTAYVLRDGGDSILVDPLVAGETEPLLAALGEIVRGRVRILVTTPSTCGLRASVAALARPASGLDLRA
jgi:hypothetical protein